MRVALVVHKFPPESIGGTEIYTSDLAHALADNGHEVHVFYPSVQTSHKDIRERQDGVYLWRAPLSPDRLQESPIRQFWHTFRSASIEKEFTRFVAAVQPEIVHFQHVQGVSARLIALATGRPRLLTLHDYWFFCANSQLVRPDQQVCDGPRAGWNCVDCATARADISALRMFRPLVALPFAYRNRYLRTLLDQIDLLIAPSEFLRRLYIRHGFAADRIIVIENGLDVRRLLARPTSGSFIPPIRPHFGFIGSISWQKGVHVLIEAFNQLSPDAALTIYGDDKTFPEYAQHLKSLARHPYIRFGGRLDPYHVGPALRQIDCLVVPSLWYENSPLVIQEAFASGVPVIASRLGALTEKVHDGKTGRLFTPGDSNELARVLRELVQKPQLLLDLKRNIRPGPTIQEHAQQLEAIYQTLARHTRKVSSQ